MKHLPFKNKLFNLLFFLVPIVLAVVIFIILKNTAADLPMEEKREHRYTHQVMPISEISFTPKTKVHGTLEPDKVWQAISQVEGPTVYTHPNLRSGKYVQKGALLLKIDPTPYRLSYAQASAEYQRIQTEIQQIQQQMRNENALLKLETESLALALKSRQRSRDLLKEQVISQSQMDTEENALLKQKYQIQILKNSLSLNPVKIKTLKAGQSASQALMKMAQLNLKYCEIRVPFNAVLANVQLENTQYVGPRQKLFEAYGKSAMKVDAQIPLYQLKQILGSSHTQVLNQMLNNPGQGAKLSHLLQAKIMFPDEKSGQSWPAEVVSVRETANQSTRSLGLTLLLKSQSGLSLLKGTYVEIEIQGPQKHKQILVPRFAVHQEKVYLVDDKKHLKTQPIKTGLTQEDFIVVTKGLKVGDQLIVSNPNPVIEGMDIEPVKATETLAKLKKQIQGSPLTP